MDFYFQIYFDMRIIDNVINIKVSMDYYQFLFKLKGTGVKNTIHPEKLNSTASLWHDGFDTSGTNKINSNS